MACCDVVCGGGQLVFRCVDGEVAEGEERDV